MEDYLLDCIEQLQRAGDDSGRRKSEIQRPKAWNLLNKEWKALAFLAVEQAAPDSIDINSSNGKSAKSNRRIGRRGGRGSRSGLQDRLELPQSVIRSKESSAYRLAVLIAQKHKMGTSWNNEWDKNVLSLREECQAGVHPVWERMARETPLLAELGRFPISENEQNTDAGDWLSQANFDPQDQSALLSWLESCTLQLDVHQASTLQKITRDLRGGKPRPQKWKAWMNPSLKDMSGDYVLLESMLSAAAGDGESASLFDSIGSKNLKSLVKAQTTLLSLRSGSAENWNDAASNSGEDRLSKAIKIEAWNNFQSGNSIDIDSLLNGMEILENAGLAPSDSLRWAIIAGLNSANRAAETVVILRGLEINNEEEMRIAISLVAETGDSSIETSILKGLAKSSDELTLSVMRNSSAPLNIRKKAAKKLSTKNLGIEEEVLDIYTLSADVEGLSREFLSHSELVLKFPHRALLVWHLIPAEQGVSIMQELEAMRKRAILALAETEYDEVMTAAASSLIALLSGNPSSMDAVHEKLDSKGLEALNQVRAALRADGDGLVEENRIERLEQSVEDAGLTFLESSLFSVLISALRLNRATMDLQSGVGERVESALSALGPLCSTEGVELRTIRFATALVLEHNAAIPDLEMWYRQHDNGSSNHQIVRATIAVAKGDRINAARSYRDAAMRIRGDFEQSSLLLRKSLIEFALAGGWKEAIDLIDKHPELLASVTSRFQLYLRVCSDAVAGRNEIATQRIIEYISEREPSEDDADSADREVVKRRLEVLDRALRYASEHRLPEDPFRGRVLAAQMMIRRKEPSRRSELEGRFLMELNERKDVLEITLIAEEVADISPIRGLRMFETAIQSDNFDSRQIQTLVRSQKALFRRHSKDMPIRQRRSLSNLSLRPLVLVDTNILIDALKDDLLGQISQDNYGTFDWTVERAFVWMLKRRSEEGRVHLCIPMSAEAEFLNRTRSPKIARALFRDVYIDNKAWKSTVTSKLLQQRVEYILRTFGKFRPEVDMDAKREIDLESFLIRHSEIFERVTEAKQLARDDPPPRSVIDGKDIFPESGDLDIMRDSTVHAASTIPDVGCVLVATRDSDFTLISRALHDNFGFDAISTAQQLNSHILRS
ncbi:MAG: hypothetical protein VYB30_05090 [Candidatus Thermoplasmatota archaeon]|nr:hypothetical protein [Candidatus Thermoplasmatota archaeon]